MAAELYKTGVSVAEIMKRLGMKEKAVVNTLERRGLIAKTTRNFGTQTTE